MTGQKVWTSLAQYAQRCVLLTRTAPGHGGITAFFVDMDSPGITVRPLRTMHGVDEFAEVFFDDVVVPGDRMLGKPGDGWRLAMDLLPYERSTCFWHRIAYLFTRLDRLLRAGHGGRCTVADEAAGSGRRTWPCTRPLPVPRDPVPAGGRRHPRPGDVGRQDPAAKRRAAALRHRARPAARRGRAGRSRRGARNTCTRGRRRSTAAPPRSSATSSPAGCSTWGRSDWHVDRAEELDLLAEALRKTMTSPAPGARPIRR